MQIKVVVYQNPFDSTVVYNQYIIQWEVSIVQDLYGIDEAKFTMPYIQWLDDEQRGVDLYEVTTNEDKKIFEWYFKEVDPRFQGGAMMDVIARSKKEFLKDRIALADNTYTNAIAKNIISDLVAPYNTDWDWRVVDRWLYITYTDPLVSMEVKVGDNYYDIFDEIAKQIGGQWDYKNNTIYFAKELGTDYTTSSSPKYIELYYNGTTWMDTVIKRMKLRVIADRKNIIVGVDDQNVVNIQKSISWWKIYWATKENFRDWDLVQKTISKLAELNRKQKIYTLEVDTLKIEANKWDKIKIRIEWHRCPDYNMNNAMLILKKTTNYKDWTRKDTLQIAEYAIQERTLETKIVEIKKIVDLKSI